MFDDNSFADTAFERNSWLMSLAEVVAATKRVVRSMIAAVGRMM